MRRKTQRRMLQAMGHVPFEPSDEQRKMVTILKFNGVPNQRIANVMRLSLVELEYYFRFELDLGQDTLLAHATENILWLADQRQDLGVSLRANSSILVNRVPGFREPQATTTPSAAQINEMRLEQLDDEIERLEREIAASAADEAQEEGTADDEG